MLTPKNQLADMLTQGSLTRDEWCNLLRLSKIMKFSLFSRSHSRSVKKATTISKRIQERKTEGEPAVAKPRSVCSISTNLNREQSSFSGNPQLDSGSVQRSCGKLPATCSQVWKEDKPSQGSCGKLQRGSLCERSGKLQRIMKSNWIRSGWTTMIC